MYSVLYFDNEKRIQVNPIRQSQSINRVDAIGPLTAPQSVIVSRPLHSAFTDLITTWINWLPGRLPCQQQYGHLLLPTSSKRLRRTLW